MYKHSSHLVGIRLSNTGNMTEIGPLPKWYQTLFGSIMHAIFWYYALIFYLLIPYLILVSIPEVGIHKLFIPARVDIVKA